MLTLRHGFQGPKTKQDGNSTGVGGWRWEYGLGSPECPLAGCPWRTPVAIRTREEVWYEQELGLGTAGRALNGENWPLDPARLTIRASSKS